MIVAICFEKEHRFEWKVDKYVCQSCGSVISEAEFRGRCNANTWVNGKAPLWFCALCETWHVPGNFDINSRMEISHFGRNIEIIDMKNGSFVYETDRDESGYVTSAGWCDAVEKIKSCVSSI